MIYSCNTLYMFQTIFFVHHQELKTAYTAIGICQPAVAVYAVLSPWWWTKKSSETCRVYYKNTSFEKWVHLVGCTIRMYYDARTYECQIHLSVNFCVFSAGNYIEQIYSNMWSVNFNMQAEISGRLHWSVL